MGTIHLFTKKRNYGKGYREEVNVDPSSHTETFVAMKLEIANWRWQGVPVLYKNR